MLVVDDERPGVAGMEDNCAIVVAVVVPMAVADVDVVAVAVVAVVVDAVVVSKAVVDVDLVVVVAAAVVDAFVVAVIGELAAVQLATGRLEQEHREGLVEQSCGFR
jgi:hypothetical protein